MKHSDVMDALTVAMGLALAIVMTLGCGAAQSQTHGVQHAHHDGVKAPSLPRGMGKDWTASARCKKLGTRTTPNVGVLVERNCMRPGLTTVGIVVFNNSRNGVTAARDSARLVLDILGFKPKLTILFVGKTGGKVFFLSAVTGYHQDNGPVASTK